MLVLARKINESLMIGNDIKITIVRIQGNIVRLGITAPNDLPVHREEIYIKIKQEEQENATKQ